MVGPKRSGKGTIGRVLTALLGRHNVAAPTLAGLGTNFGLQELITRPLGLISDARLSTRSDASVVAERLLSISGEDSLTVDRKYKDPWTGRLPTRFMILTNELPDLKDASGALASRFILFILTRSFYGRENPKLTQELLEEAPGILNWALDGLDRLNERGWFEMPESSKGIIQQMEDLASPVGAFIRRMCVLSTDAEIETDELWDAWKAYCETENIRLGTKAVFGKDLAAAAPTVKRLRQGERDARQYMYTGITSRARYEETARTARTPNPEKAPGPSSLGKNGQTTATTFCVFNCANPAIGIDGAGNPYCEKHVPIGVRR
jgi:putative DNA primase/helicase